MAANDKIIKHRRRAATLDGNVYRYEFIFTPCNGFLQSSEPLMKDCELKIRFERAPWNVAIQAISDNPEPITEIELKDVHAITEYISSPNLRTYFDKIDNNPIVYQYEESDAIVKTLPQNETEIRIDGIKGGNLPSYVFAGIIPQSSLLGDAKHSSTCFKAYGVKEFNLTLNGNSVNGFPMTIKNECPVLPMHKFFDTTNRFHNVKAGENISQSNFLVNWIWGHKFESEHASQGWLGVNLKLDAPFTESMSLVIWFVSPCAISIDKFHQLERINL